MNREEMIEKAARASHQEGLDAGAEYAQWDDLRERVRQEYRSNAAAVLDAILPQVTTVEELEALPFDAKLIDSTGEVWARYHMSASGQRPLRWRSSRGNYGQTSARLIAMGLGPLTVVWSPS